MAVNQNQIPRRPTSVAKRQAIMNAAINSFFSNGFAETSIESIAREANVSKITVYNHFRNKRNLLAEAIFYECDKLRSSEAFVTPEEGSLIDRLVETGKQIVKFFSCSEMIQFERRIAAETDIDPSLGDAFLKAGPHRIRDLVAELFVKLDIAGELTIKRPDIAAEQFVSLCKGLGDVERRFGQVIDPAQDIQRIEASVGTFLRAFANDQKADLK